jgi:hypothetical protein
LRTAATYHAAKLQHNNVDSADLLSINISYQSVDGDPYNPATGVSGTTSPSPCTHHCTSIISHGPDVLSKCAALPVHGDDAYNT